MARLRYDNSIGTLGASLSSGGTTITFSSAPSFATITGSDYIPLIIEPPSGSTPSAGFEIVWLTAYVAGATTGTILRGMEGTSASAHSNSVVWAHGPSAADIGQQGTMLFWGGSTGISRAHADASSVDQEFVYGITGAPYGLVVVKRTLYWLDQGNVQIGRSRFDGACLTNAFVKSLVNTPTGLCSDGTYLYWSQASGIGRCDLYGQGANSLFVSSGALFRAKSAAVTGGGNITVTVPSSVVAGDTLFMVVSTVANGQPSSLTGWSKIVQTTGASDNQCLTVFSKTAVGGDASSNVTIGSTNSSCGVCYAYSNCSVDAVQAVVQANSSGTVGQPTDVNTGERQLVCIAGASGSTFTGAPTFSAGGSNTTVSNTSFTELGVEDFTGAISGGALNTSGGFSTQFIIATIGLKAAASNFGVCTDGTNLYWANSAGFIGRATLAGGSINTTWLDTGLGANSITGLCTDGTFLYFTRNSGTIGRVSLAGTGLNTSFITTNAQPYDVQTDGTYLYWTNLGTSPPTIGRATLAGGSVNNGFLSVANGGLRSLCLATAPLTAENV